MEFTPYMDKGGKGLMILIGIEGYIDGLWVSMNDGGEDIIRWIEWSVQILIKKAA